MNFIPFGGTWKPGTPENVCLPAFPISLPRGDQRDLRVAMATLLVSHRHLPNQEVMIKGVLSIHGGGLRIVPAYLIFKLKLDLLPESGGYLDRVQEVVVKPDSKSMVNVVIAAPADISDILLTLVLPNTTQKPHPSRRLYTHNFLKRAT